MTDVESALRELRACVSSGDSAAAEVLMFGPLDDLAMLEEPWSDALFEGVADLLHDERFLRLEAFWKLVELLMYKSLHKRIFMNGDICLAELKR